MWETELSDTNSRSSQKSFPASWVQADTLLETFLNSLLFLPHLMLGFSNGLRGLAPSQRCSLGEEGRQAGQFPSPPLHPPFELFPSGDLCPKPSFHLISSPFPSPPPKGKLPPPLLIEIEALACIVSECESSHETLPEHTLSSLDVGYFWEKRPTD